MAKRIWYEVRIREQVAPNQWRKISKFYKVKRPQDARNQYDGSGFVMWVRKKSQHKALGIGGFFGLGDQLLREFAQERKEGGDKVQQALKKQVDIRDVGEQK